MNNIAHSFSFRNWRELVNYLLGTMGPQEQP